ncbi:MAG: glycolate oxidase subunit GlcE [Gammaproteobacteria bacterium]|nr:glycolate oxidase subunit GlcE [Gammaproteobacteria bacterium]
MTPDCAQADAILQGLKLQLAEARRNATPLRIEGGNSKSDWWQTSAVLPFSLRDYRGIVRHEPSELVVTARAGTPLSELENLLGAHGQCLAAEPPTLSPSSTVGGSVAAGLSGPARPWRGALRDHVLGVKLLAANGEVLRFGGEVMKNVAGYDVSRLCTGAWGRLGPLLEISLRVAPVPVCSVTATWQVDEGEALRRMTEMRRAPLPLSGCLHHDGFLHVRLSGAPAAVEAALAVLRPERREEEGALWTQWRDHQHSFFQRPGRIWRVSVPPATPPLGDFGEHAIDWMGAVRWYRWEGEGEVLAETAAARGGFCRPWRHPGFSAGERGATGLLEQRVTASFNPDRLFNPGLD